MCIDSVMRRYGWEKTFTGFHLRGGGRRHRGSFPPMAKGPMQLAPFHDYIVKSEFPTNQVHN